MEYTLYIIFTTIFLLSSFVIGKIIYYRKNIACMTGMMGAMALGMIVGLLIGVILGINFSGNLFLSTVIGMLAGILTGFLAGLPISVMATLDGILSGLMGGMMGAMLGDMIMLEYREAIVRIMFVLFLSTLLILLYMIQKEVNSKRKVLYENPVILIAMFVLLFLGLYQLGPLFPDNNSPNPHTEHHMNE